MREDKAILYTEQGEASVYTWVRAESNSYSAGPQRSLKSKHHAEEWRVPHKHSGSYSEQEAEVICGWVWEKTDKIKLHKVHEPGALLKSDDGKTEK